MLVAAGTTAEATVTVTFSNAQPGMWRLDGSKLVYSDTTLSPSYRSLSREVGNVYQSGSHVWLMVNQVASSMETVKVLPDTAEVHISYSH